MGKLTIVSISIALFSSVGFLCGLIIFLFNKKKIEVNSDLDEHVLTYQYLSVSPDLNTSSYGFVRIPKMMEQEYFFYGDDEGNMNLVSNVGSTEYMCTGSCYYQPDSSRRFSSTGSVLRKSLTYLLPATATIIAIDKAKSYFESKCIEEFGEAYAESNIKTEVDRCEEFYKDGSFSDGTDKPKEYEEGTNLKHYICSGACLPRKNRWNDPERLKMYDCNQHRRENVEISVKTETEVVYDIARVRFITHYLMVFCWEVSKFDMSYEYQSKDGGLVKDQFVSSHCFGGDADNPTVNCRKLL